MNNQIRAFAVAAVVAGILGPGRAAGQVARFYVYRVPSSAMEPTVHVRETLTFDRYWEHDSTHQANPPQFREIVLYHLPGETIVAAKRVLGVPGGTLEMRAGRLRRNGHQLEEGYVRHSKPDFVGDSADRASMRTWQLPFVVSPSATRYAPDLQNWGPLVVPDSAVAVLGDNRDESYDTRYFGFIRFDRLVGRLLRIYDPESGVVRWTADSAAP